MLSVSPLESLLNPQQDPVKATLPTAQGQRLVARLRVSLFCALTAQEVAFFDTHRTGDLISRLSSDTRPRPRARMNLVGFAFGLLGIELPKWSFLPPLSGSGFCWLNLE